MIVIVDYGMGNLRSVSKALEHLGGDVRVSSEPAEIEAADKLVLPGVGAFGDAMAELRRRGQDQAILAHIQKGKPFFGICLGLQLLFEESEESPGVAGLGVLSGRVQAFRSTDVKIPHMGWNRLDFCQEHPVLEHVLNSSFFYFVHSYYAVPANPDLVVGFCEYGSDRVTAVVADRNVFAVQFHPEKSQGAGLQILKNFIDWKTDESLSRN